MRQIIVSRDTIFQTVTIEISRNLHAPAMHINLGPEEARRLLYALQHVINGPTVDSETTSDS